MYTSGNLTTRTILLAVIQYKKRHNSPQVKKKQKHACNELQKVLHQQTVLLSCALQTEMPEK